MAEMPGNRCARREMDFTVLPAECRKHCKTATYRAYPLSQ